MTAAGLALAAAAVQACTVPLPGPGCQPVLLFTPRPGGGGNWISVSCTCLGARLDRRRGARGRALIETRQRWEPGEAYRAWAGWHARLGTQETGDSHDSSTAAQ